MQNQRALRAYTESARMGTLRTAQLFALADTASADALIACWDSKYHFEFWRPFTAIPAADTDRNADTPADPAWRPLLPTPNFPEYPSAPAARPLRSPPSWPHLPRHTRLTSPWTPPQPVPLITSPRSANSPPRSPTPAFGEACTGASPPRTAHALDAQ